MTPLKTEERGVEQGITEPARDKAAVSRNQNVMYVLPHDAAAIAQFMGPVLEQIDAPESSDAPGPRTVVVTPDVVSAVAIARFIASSPIGAASTDTLRVIAATGARRSARLLAARSTPIVVGPADQLLDLVRRAALKLENVRALVIAWADLVIDAGAVPSLEALMSEMPKDAARTVVAARTTPDVEAIVERYARRPRRVGEVAEAPAESIGMRYVMTGNERRPTTLRAVLDALDPPGAAVYARSDESAREANETLRVLGYAADDIVRVVRDGSTPAALMVLYDIPASRAELEQLAAAAPNQVVALVQPRQLPVLVALAGVGGLVPLSLDASIAAARTAEQRTRDEIRAVLERGLPARELLVVEPLLVDFDAASVAAATLHLLAASRERPAPNAATPPSASIARPNASTAADDARAPRAAPASGPVRMFVNVGERDGATARDLVGAIANEGGIAGSRIGRVEIRENHSIVELDAADAARAVEALSNATIRGRRVSARIDNERSSSRGRGGPRDRGG
ncbi:MAG: DbpA RNA binding domain-containing protein, partial [Gemmatimonadaceae bacterium]